MTQTLIYLINMNFPYFFLLLLMLLLLHDKESGEKGNKNMETKILFLKKYLNE